MDRTRIIAAATALFSACAPSDADPMGSSESSGDATTTSTATSSTTVASTSSGPDASSGSDSDADSDSDSTSSSESSSSSSSSSGGCVERLPPLDEAPASLSETGLYDDITTRTLAADILEFTPRFPLWSDGADKLRYAWLPACDTIDTSDMDAWELPVGTRLWKQFTRDGVTIETRLIARTGPAPTDWLLVTYVWNGDDAELVTDGVENALGTQHDVPEQVQCTSCHRTSWRVLGLSAIQLAHDGEGTTLTTLADDGRLSDPPLAPIVVPGDATAQAALGVLHANCGNCHNEDGVPFVDLQLRLRTDDTTVEDTQAWQTTVDTPPVMFQCGGCDLLEPGVPETSALVLRMNVRGPQQMPPLATELVDEEGVDALSQWILSLPAG